MSTTQAEKTTTAFEAVIGIECHVELKTETKMFCGCRNVFGGEPNTHVCPVCLGLPGVLPVMNEKAVEYGVKVGLALHCDVAPFAKMDRKNYYYPDLPKNPQGLHEFCNKQDHRFVDSRGKFLWKDGEAAFNFGKYKGELLRKLAKDNRDYLEWIVNEGKFPQDVIDICWKALRGEFPKKPELETLSNVAGNA